MSGDKVEQVRQTVDGLYSSESRRFFATLIRILALARQERERRFLERRLFEWG